MTARSPAESPARTNLYDLAPSELATVVGAIVSPPYRVGQIQQWLYERGASSFEEMTNIPKTLREELARNFTIDPPAVQDVTAPAADESRKYLFRLGDGSLIEAVYMPMGARTTLCLSSQAGCAVGCTFCVTGFFGAGRNLSPAEMIGQVEVIRSDQQIDPERLNIVFMGMGEPLLNLDNVVTTLEILEKRISHRRVTLSTSGITPAIEELAALERRPNLAVSINAPDQARREEIMPITRKYPLTELIEALKTYPLERGRELTAEYVLLEGFNDSLSDARALARLLRNLRCKVNVIPFNPDPMLPAWMKRPADSAIDTFVGELVRRGAQVTVRRSKGQEIAAACGQLRGKTEKRRRA